MLAPDCDHAVDGLTQFDLAYLQGLYRMAAGRKAIFQRNDIADAMVDTLAKAKSGRRQTCTLHSLSRVTRQSGEVSASPLAEWIGASWHTRRTCMW